MKLFFKKWRKIADENVRYEWTSETYFKKAMDFCSNPMYYSNYYLFIYVEKFLRFSVLILEIDLFIRFTLWHYFSRLSIGMFAGSITGTFFVSAIWNQLLYCTEDTRSSGYIINTVSSLQKCCIVVLSCFLSLFRC